MDDEDFSALEADLEAELLREMESAPAPPPEPEPEPEPKSKRPPGKRPRRGGRSGNSQSDGIEALAAVASAGSSEAGPEARTAARYDDAAEDGDDDAPGYIWGMNIITGRSREDEEAEQAAHAQVAQQALGVDVPDADTSERKRPRGKMVELRYGSYQGMQLSVAEVRRIKAEECRALLARRKLSLVLDLDHTLLNSAMYNELDQESGDQLEAWHTEERGYGSDSRKAAGPGDIAADDSGADGDGEGGDGAGGDGGAGDGAGDGGGGPSGPFLLHHLRHIHMWTKLRPHVFEFLSGAAQMYELYVYTMGAKAYAAEMVKLLDPDGSLGLSHSDRVIGKEDSTAAHTKDLDVILGSERTAIIVDDSPQVWPQFASQLLVPRRYHFFASSAARDSSLPAGKEPHLLAKLDEPAADGQLHALLAALTKIHTHYFAGLASAPAGGDEPAPSLPPHVSDSVRAVRRQVLRSARIVFSHVIPLEQQSKPETSAAYRLAVELGAAVQTQASSSTTHVVAGSDGTEKVRWARSKGVHAVSVEWLASCGYLWRAVDEKSTPIDGKLAKAGAAGEKLPQQLCNLPPPDIAASKKD